MREPKVIMVPGYGNSGPDHWQSIWQARLPGATRVHQRDWEEPKLDEWLAGLEAAILAVQGPVVLVGHSLGSVLITHLARKPVARRVAGAILVAVPDIDWNPLIGARLRGFTPMPRQGLPFSAIMVASTNDPYMRIDQAQHLARYWRAAFENAGPLGHINAASGCGEWPAGWTLLQQYLAYIRREEEMAPEVAWEDPIAFPLRSQAGSR